MQRQTLLLTEVWVVDSDMRYYILLSLCFTVQLLLHPALTVHGKGTL